MKPRARGGPGPLGLSSHVRRRRRKEDVEEEEEEEGGGEEEEEEKEEEAWFTSNERHDCTDLMYTSSFDAHKDIRDLPRKTSGD
jgi:hypothetical protein